MILVAIESGDPDRIGEALRAAIGLGLRGDRVAVIFTGPAATVAPKSDDPRIVRALRTLAELRRPAEAVDASELPARIRAARAVEVWTSGSSRRTVRLGDRELEVWPDPPRFRLRGAPVDGADLVAQILGSDGPVVVR